MANAIPEHTMREIERKALAGIPMDTPTPEKQQAYDAFRQANPTNQNIMASQNDMSANALGAIEEMLRKMTDSSFQSQDAMLQQTRDQELSALQKALNDAVAQGEISVREAERQFEMNKQEIDKRAYQDAELTQLHSQERGIQNSAQMVGLMQGDQARKQSLVNTNMTDRDMRINDVRDRLNAIKQNVSLDMASANSKYGYASASARGQADAQLQQSLAQMYLSDHEMNRQQSFSLDQMSLQQRHQLELMAEQFGLDLKRMDAEQIHVLARMAEQFGYDQTLQSNQFRHNEKMQASQQAHANAMRKASESHAVAMFNKQQQSEVDKYNTQLQRALNAYDAKTPEGQLRIKDIEASIQAMHIETNHKVLADVAGRNFANVVGSPPQVPAKGFKNKAEYDKYEAQVNSYNKTVQNFMSGNYESLVTQITKAPYSENKKSTIMDYIKSFSIPSTFGGVLGGIPGR